ncbi:S10 family peptidase [Undibacterium terreum]|uniref:Lipoprotein n=1 Tax=Undibacterium terreum TaxID=1224302 RepID=A0A916XQB4_9BURK|nr:peptidase S10 [Undibacterium terreum]GGC95910.1 lipoprotein [Undibacterium terreum]
MATAHKQIWAGILTILLSLLSACGGGGSSAPASGGNGTGTPVSPGNGDQAYADPVFYSGAANASLAMASEQAAQVHSQLSLNGKTIAYTSSSGHLTASDLKTGAASASFFYVAYTADNQDAAKRPVTFFYNGGPGSATIWLHMGSYAPKRIVTNAPATSLANPVPFIDNAESLLDTSDLVFVDAVGTGYSQAIAPNTNQSFWGVDQDAAVFRDFVIRYVAAYQRSSSPKFLFGESYGTPRTAVLANLLETAGVKIDGIVLQSSILNYNVNCGVLYPVTISCDGYLPSYAATGAYYSLSSPVPTDLAGYLAQVRSFSAASYRPAVLAYLANHTSAPAGLVAQASAYTGLTASYWQQNINVTPDTFQQFLLPGSLIGRYDARIFAANGSALASGGDPSSTLITASFSSIFSSYLSTQLKYSANSTYIVSSPAINSWNFQHDGIGLPDTVPDLAAALLLNPAMQVLSLNGYHDLATPFYQTEMDLARLGSNANIQIRNYSGGHMNYLDDASRKLAKADLLKFYAAAVAAH